MKTVKDTHQPIETDCPSCGNYSRFKFIGEQKWSQAVADKLGVPTIINLYNCAKCHSTVTDVQLLPQ
ncbi:MAG: hypothetical protein AAFV93_04640 [Chloroflexota bacterium]